MDTALHTAGLSSQNHQGTGVRLVHRFGNALRGLIAGSIALTSTRRRKTTTRSNRGPAAQGEANPVPTRPRAPRRPRAAPQVAAPPAARHGWIARLFRRKAHRAPTASRAPAARKQDAPFTPDAYPGLSSAACAILNTPAKDLDPALLHLMLSGIARHLAANLPPDMGLDANAIFAKMAGRLGIAPDAILPEAAPAEVPPFEPAPSPQAGPGVAQAEPDIAQAAMAPPSQTEAPAAAPVPITLPAATCEIAPDRAVRRVFHRRRERTPSRLPSLLARRRHPRSTCRARPQRSGVFRRQHHAPPIRRLTYAACAGPP